MHLLKMAHIRIHIGAQRYCAIFNRCMRLRLFGITVKKYVINKPVTYE